VNLEFHCVKFTLEYVSRHIWVINATDGHSQGIIYRILSKRCRVFEDSSCHAVLS